MRNRSGFALCHCGATLPCFGHIERLDPRTLDERFRAIVAAATPETSLSATQALVDLGFGAATAFQVICKALEVKR